MQSVALNGAGLSMQVPAQVHQHAFLPEAPMQAALLLRRLPAL